MALSNHLRNTLRHHSWAAGRYPSSSVHLCWMMMILCYRYCVKERYALVLSRTGVAAAAAGEGDSEVTYDEPLPEPEPDEPPGLLPLEGEDDVLVDAYRGEGWVPQQHVATTADNSCADILGGDLASLTMIPKNQIQTTPNQKTPSQMSLHSSCRRSCYLLLLHRPRVLRLRRRLCASRAPQSLPRPAPRMQVVAGRRPSPERRRRRRVRAPRRGRGIELPSGRISWFLFARFIAKSKWLLCGGRVVPSGKNKTSEKQGADGEPNSIEIYICWYRYFMIRVKKKGKKCEGACVRERLCPQTAPMKSHGDRTVSAQG